MANPYAGGTIIGTTTGTGTTAVYSGAVLPIGNLFVYAILNPTPADAACRPFATTSVTINAIPSAPTSTDEELCGAGTVTLTTASGCSGGTLNWYDAPTAGTLLGSGASYSASVSGTTTYYVDCTVSGCTSSRNAVLVTDPDPTITISGDTEYCLDETVNLIATTMPSGSSVTWDYGVGTSTGGTLTVPASVIGAGTTVITATAVLGNDDNCNLYY